MAVVVRFTAIPATAPEPEARSGRGAARRSVCYRRYCVVVVVVAAGGGADDTVSVVLVDAGWLQPASNAVAASSDVPNARPKDFLVAVIFFTPE